MKTGGFGDWERSKIDSVWKSWGEKESERSNRLADSVMRCCFEKRHPVSCCSNHFTASDLTLKKLFLDHGKPLFPTQIPKHLLCVKHKTYFQSLNLWRHKYCWRQITSDSDPYFKVKLKVYRDFTFWYIICITAQRFTVCFKHALTCEIIHCMLFQH